MVGIFAFLFNCPPAGWTSGPDALAVVRPTWVYLMDLFCSGNQFYLLLSHIFALSPFYLDLYVLGDDALIS